MSGYGALTRIRRTPGKRRRLMVCFFSRTHGKFTKKSVSDDTKRISPSLSPPSTARPSDAELKALSVLLRRGLSLARSLGGLFGGRARVSKLCYEQEENPLETVGGTKQLDETA